MAGNNVNEIYDDFVKAGTLFWARVPVQTAFNSVLLCLPIDIEHGKFRRKMLAIT